MAEIDFLPKLKSFTESLTYTPSVIQIGTYIENQTSIALRPAPANPDTRYFDKGMTYPFSFQNLVHHPDALEAYTMAEKLRNEYENVTQGTITTSNGSFVLTKIECTTVPNYVQKTSYGTLYTAIYNAELEII